MRSLALSRAVVAPAQGVLRRRLSAAATSAGEERRSMNMFTAINDALRVALETDPTAVRVVAGGG
jgi:hypothetical protein